MEWNIITQPRRGEGSTPLPRSALPSSETVFSASPDSDCLPSCRKFRFDGKVLTQAMPWCEKPPRHSSVSCQRNDCGGKPWGRLGRSIPH